MAHELLNVAIVGAGPAGFYTAEALAAQGEHVRIDLLDRLPTPYGLIRGGVAPDHQSIKQVFRRYEKTALKPNVRFLGNLELGRDVSIEELLALYDAVVLACGAPQDRKLGIAGEDLPGVWGSAAFVGWYNSHPDFSHLEPDLDTPSVAVVGNGNVAIDAARVLAKTKNEMAHADLAPYAAEAIERAPIRDIYILGRRGPVEAKFTPKELGEMGELERCVPLVDPAQLPPEAADDTLEPGKRKVMALLRQFARNRPGDKPVRLHFGFYAKPTAVLGQDRVEGLQLERTRVENGQCLATGETFEIACGLVVTCIGYRSMPIRGAPFDDGRGRFRNEEGHISERLYAVGWARRGPTGTIGTNKPDGAEIAARILAEIRPDHREGGIGLDALIAERGLEVVRFEDWKRIEESETAAAQGQHPRLKFSRVEDMLQLLANASSASHCR